MLLCVFADTAQRDFIAHSSVESCDYALKVYELVPEEYRQRLRNRKKIYLSGFCVIRDFRQFYCREHLAFFNRYLYGRKISVLVMELVPLLAPLHHFHLFSDLMC